MWPPMYRMFLLSLDFNFSPYLGVGGLNMYYLSLCLGEEGYPTTLYLHRLTTRSACPPGLDGSRLQHAWWRKNRLFKVNTSSARPADLHLLVGSWKMGGIAYVYDWQERSYDPPECHPWQQAYTFLIRILSTSFISVSIFSVCCYSWVFTVSQWNLATARQWKGVRMKDSISKII